MSVGDGATSEGEFWESLNTTCSRPVPMLYLVEDNGYAISVPVEVQTPGGDISRLVEGFPNLKVLRCDGTDFLESYRVLGDAVAWVRRERKPAFVHARVTRPYSHSLSDDERLYKTPQEREAEAQRDPLVRMRAFLLAEGLADRGRPGRAGGGGRSRDRRGHRRGAGRAAANRPTPPPTGCSRPTSTRRLRRSTPPRSPRADPTRWWRRSTARSRTRWRTTRASSSSARTWPTPAGRPRSARCRARAASSR